MEEKKANTQKRKLKTDPKLKVELNEEQKQVIENLYNYDVVFVEGKWGSGKSMSCVAAAIKAFRKKEVDRIVVTRPFIRRSVKPIHQLCCGWDVSDTLTLT